MTTQNSQKPRIAICLSGFIRTWEYTRHSFLHKLCADYPVDVFVHTYEQNYHEYSADCEDVKITPNDVIGMLKGIPAKVIKLENRDIIIPKLKEDFNHLSHVKNFDYSIKESSDTDSKEIPLGYRIIDQLRKIEHCNELRKWYEKQNNVKYDIVIRARFDMFYISNLNIPYENMVEDEIYTEDGSMGGYPRDGVVAGRAETMDKAFNCRYSKLNELFLSKAIPGGSCDCGNIVPCCELCAHRTMAHLFDMNNIKVRTGFIHGMIMRSPETFVKPFFGTVKFEQQDPFIQKGLYMSLFPELCYIEDLNDCIFDIPPEKNIVLVTNAKRDLVQTLETLKSVREKIPDSYIILLEAFKVDIKDIAGLYSYIDKYVLYHNDMDSVMFTKQKSLGETYKIRRALKHLPHENRLFKITGRYTFNNHFDYTNFITSNENISAQVYNENTPENPSQNYFYNITKNEVPDYRITYCVNTTVYSVPSSCRRIYANAIHASLSILQQSNKDIEHVLYELLDKNMFTNVQRLGIQGTIGPMDELHEW